MHFSDNLQRWRLSLGEREHGRIICPTCARSANIVQADYGGLSSVPVVSCDVCGFITSVDSVANVPKEWYDPVTAELKAYVDIANELLALADDIGDRKSVV